MVAVYQWGGWLGGIFDVANPGAVLSFLPIILIGVLFGLAMDYQVFITSGMRESFMHGESAKHAVRSGFSHAAAVVTAAAIIMVSVFSGFIFSHLTMVRPLGFAMAFGVLIDAFVVRMTIVPAVMYLLGEKAGGCPSGWNGSSRMWMWKAPSWTAVIAGTPMPRNSSTNPLSRNSQYSRTLSHLRDASERAFGLSTRDVIERQGGEARGM